MALFLSENLKKSDDGACNYLLKDVNKFIEEIKSMEEKINLSLLGDFFGFSSPTNYAKELINIKNADKNKGIVEEIVEDRISDLEDRIKQMSDKEKEEKNADETLEIINKILGYNKNNQNFFHCASKVDKKNQNQRLKKVLWKEQN